MDFGVLAIGGDDFFEKVVLWCIGVDFAGILGFGRIEFNSIDMSGEDSRRNDSAEACSASSRLSRGGCWPCSWLIRSSTLTMAI